MKRKKISRFNSFVMVMLIISFLFGFCGVGQLFGDKNEIPQTEEVSTLTGNPAKVIPEKEPVLDSGNYIVKTWDEKLEEMFDNGEGFQIPLVDGRYQISTAKELAMVSYLSNHNGVYPYPLENTKGYVEGAPIYTVTTEDSQEEYMQLDHIDTTKYLSSIYIPTTECTRISGNLTQIARGGYAGLITVSGGLELSYLDNAIYYSNANVGSKQLVSTWDTTALNNQKIYFDINENEGLFRWGSHTGQLPALNEKKSCTQVRLFYTRWSVGDQMYYHDLQFYDFNNVMTHNLIPAIRLSDKSCGLFDTIGKKFYTASAQQNRASLTVSGKAFELTNDVYLNDGKLGLAETTDESGKTTYSVAYEDGGDGVLHKWTPISHSEDIYWGGGGLSIKLDGNDKVIYGMYIESSKNNVGLISGWGHYSWSNDNPEIYMKKLHMKNSLVFAPNGSTVGGLIGHSACGKIIDCSFDGTIVGGTTVTPLGYTRNTSITGFTNYGKIIATTGSACGVGGNVVDSVNYGEVRAKGGACGISSSATNCKNYGKVTSTTSTACGISGSSATNCINYGKIKGNNAYGIGQSAGKDCTNYGNVYGTNSATGISGSGTFENSKNYGEIVSTEGSATGLFSGNANAKNCYNYGTVKGKTNVGGLYSGISGTIAIYNCINYGDVTSETAYAGGLVGVITNGNPSIIRCENVGKVTAKTTSTTTYAGGLVGSITGGSTTIESCTNEGKVSGKTATGFVGQATSICTIKNSLNNGDITSSTYEGATLSSTFGANKVSQLTNCITSSKINGEKVNACAYVKDGYFSEQYRTGKIISSNASHTAQFQGVIDSSYIKENNFIDFTPTPEDSNKLYTKLEYIQSDGNQYINSGVKFSPNLKIQTTYELTKTTENRNYIFGLVDNNSSRVQWSHSPESFAGFNTTYEKFGMACEEDKYYTMIMDKGIFKLNDSVVSNQSGQATGSITNNTLTIFGCYTDGQVTIYSNIKMYSFIIWDNGTLIRNFIPAKRNSDGMVGLYDTVESKFYTDANGGNFKAGPKASLVPAGYTELESIKSNGSQYIDTGVVMGDHIEVQAGFKYNSKQNTSGIYDTALFGVGVSGVASNFCVFYTSGNKFTAYYNSFNTGTINTDLEYHDVVFNRKTDRGILIDGDLYGNINAKLWNQRNLYLFKSNQSNLVTGAQANIYYVRLYDNGTLIRNFIPAKRNSDGMIGLYDTVEKKFYTDANGGNFEVGD